MISFLARRPGWPTHVAAVVASVVLLWGARMPGADLPYLAAGVLLWLIIALVWLLRGTIAVLVWMFGRAERHALERDAWHWSCVPLLLSLAIVSICLGLPFRLAFAFSRGALEREATNALAGGEQRWLGWVRAFPIGRASVEDGDVRFGFAKQEFPWGRRGLVYCPDDIPPLPDGRTSYVRIEKHWYTMRYPGW